MNIRDYLQEADVKISVSKNEKKKVEQWLDKMDISYNDMGDTELMAQFKSNQEAEKMMKKLPVAVRYTTY